MTAALLTLAALVVLDALLGIVLAASTVFVLPALVGSALYALSLLWWTEWHAGTEN